jgi:TolB protein
MGSIRFLHVPDFLIFVTFVLVACNGRPQGDAIVLKGYRGGLFDFFNPQHTYVISADGTGSIDVNLPSGLEDEPEWSPSGEWVVFDTLYKDSARAGGQADLYLMRTDGNRRVRITDSPTDDLDPTWSPDGLRVAYAASATVTIIDVECFILGENCHPQPISLVRGVSPHWSPDGKRLVYQSWKLGGGISIIDVDGNGESVDLPPYNQYCNHPRWSPDGNKIAFNCPANVYTINIDGSGLANLTEGKYGGDPKWSPDGTKIAFISGRDGGRALDLEGSIRSDAIYLMNTDGSNVVRLSKRDDENVSWFAWLPSMKTK